MAKITRESKQASVEQFIEIGVYILSQRKKERERERKKDSASQRSKTGNNFENTDKRWNKANCIAFFFFFSIGEYIFQVFVH